MYYMQSTLQMINVGWLAGHACSLYGHLNRYDWQVIYVSRKCIQQKATKLCSSVTLVQIKYSYGDCCHCVRCCYKGYTFIRACVFNRTDRVLLFYILFYQVIYYIIQ